MEVFEPHRRVIADYTAFTQRFVDVVEERISDAVEAAIGRRALSPESWVQLNPRFEPGPDYMAIWIEGPNHDDGRQRDEDPQIDRCRKDLGYTGLRFRYDELDRWLDVIREHPGVFGVVR